MEKRFVVAIALLLSISAAGQEAERLKIKKEVDLITASAVVLRKDNGKPLGNLKRENFRLGFCPEKPQAEPGTGVSCEPVEIRVFEGRGSAPLRVRINIESSPELRPHIKNALEESFLFVKEIGRPCKKSPQRKTCDEFSLSLFRKQPYILADWNKNDIPKIYGAEKLLNYAGEDIDVLNVLLMDAQYRDLSVRRSNYATNIALIITAAGEKNPEKKEAVVASLLKTHTALYVIEFSGTSGDLKEIAESTGGKYFSIKPGNLRPVLREIAEMVSNMYTVGFYHPMSVPRSGWHYFTVEAGETKKGVFAPKKGVTVLCPKKYELK